MSTTVPAALVTGDQHLCGDAGFAVFQAGWVEQSLPDRFGRMVAAHRDFSPWPTPPAGRPTASSTS
jgi:hypothetical protein